MGSVPYVWPRKSSNWVTPVVLIVALSLSVFISIQFFALNPQDLVSDVEVTSV